MQDRKVLAGPYRVSADRLWRLAEARIAHKGGSLESALAWAIEELAGLPYQSDGAIVIAARPVKRQREGVPFFDTFQKSHSIGGPDGDGQVVVSVYEDRLP